MNKQKVLVLGGSGLVGSRFLETIDPKFQVSSPDSSQLDIFDINQLKTALSDSDVLINFAGFTDVKVAEQSRPQNPFDQQLLKDNPAYKLNVLGTKNILEACKQTEKLPIFISTDFVFDGKMGPYKEDDPMADLPDDINWYGWTKVLAEQAIKESGIDYLIVRISYPYRKEFVGKGDFGRDMLTKAATNVDGKITFNYPLFVDQKLSPTFIDDVAPAISVLIEKEKRGIYHLASPVLTTPFDFGCEVYRVAWGVEDPEKLVSRGNLAEVLEKGGSKKPLHGGLLVDKLTKDTGFTPSDWKTGIKLAYGK